MGKTIPHTRESFITKSKEVQEDEYDYSRVVYKNAHTKVEIICPIHGSFFQLPCNHLTGQRCGYCAERTKLTIVDFIEKSKAVYGDKYDYSKSIYSSANNKIQVVCPEHGSFYQNAHSHMRGIGCKKCSNEQRWYSPKIWLDKFKDVHGSKYDYSKSIFGSSKHRIEIVCKEHGSFWQITENHGRDAGCPTCARLRTSEHCFRRSIWAGKQNGRAAKLYVLRLFNDSESFIKLGITYQEIKRRYTGLQLNYTYNYEVLNLFESDTPDEIWNAELALKQKFKPLRHKPVITFPGRFECFQLNTYPEIISTIKVLLPNQF